MLYLLYGDDDLSLEEALTSLKTEVGPEELRDVNVSELDGAQVGFDELTATCDTVPFLSEKRVVVVRGLLSRFDGGASGRGRSRSRQSGDGKLGEWEGFPDYAKAMPESTDLVLVDGRLSGSNPLLAKLRPVAKVQTFPLPANNDLRQWIRQRARRYSVSIDAKAVETLADTIGQDVRVIDQELQKLSLYRAGETVRQEDVEEMVSYVREANVFAAVDAVLEGRSGIAIRFVHQIVDSGRPATYVISMIARQVRLLILAKELKAQRVSQDEIGRRLSISGYPLRQTLEQEGKFSMGRLAEIHRKLLEADLSLKSSASDEQLVLDLLIAELSAQRRGR